MKLHERVASRYVEKQGKVHATPEAREKYLKEHPKADPNKHTVKGDKDKGKDKGKDDKPKGIQRPSEDKVFKGKDVTKMSPKEKNAVIDQIAKRPTSAIRGSLHLLEIEEKQAQDAGDGKKLNEIWTKANLFHTALSRSHKKEEEAKGKK
jgi:hypothetical protein